MTYQDFIIFVLPLLTVVVAVALLFIWGAFGNTNEK